MKITIVVIGGKMPEWVKSGYSEYAKRMPRELPVSLIELPLAGRGKSVSTEKLKQNEGSQILSALPDDNQVIALDVQGLSLSTERLAKKIDGWKMSGRNVSFIIGGPDGLAPECLQRANEVWSLSAMTMPHALVRIVLIEQLYRASTILSNHPYHK